MICTNCNTEQSEDDHCGICGSNLVIGAAGSMQDPVACSEMLESLAVRFERRAKIKAKFFGKDDGHYISLMQVANELRAEKEKLSND